MNLNLSASLNIFKLIANPSLCLPHATISTFKDLPIPLDSAFQQKDNKVEIRAVILDKDDCFAVPETNTIHEPYQVPTPLLNILPAPDADILQERFAALRKAYPGHRLLIVSNTAGALSYDKKREMAAELEKATGVTVLSHQTKKPGCGPEIMEHFRKHPETGVTSPSQVAVVGDRLSTDMMLANMMGSHGVWVKDGVVPLQQKSIVRRLTAATSVSSSSHANFVMQFSRIEQRLGPWFLARGYVPPSPQSPFE